MNYWWIVIAGLLIWWLVWWLRKEGGIWFKRGGDTAGDWYDCGRCGGMGMVRFSDRKPFDSWERAHWTLEQMKAQGITCMACRGQERVFKPD